MRVQFCKDLICETLEFLRKDTSQGNRILAMDVLQLAKLIDLKIEEDLLNLYPTVGLSLSSARDLKSFSQGLADVILQAKHSPDMEDVRLAFEGKFDLAMALALQKDDNDAGFSCCSYAIKCIESLLRWEEHTNLFAQVPQRQLFSPHQLMIIIIQNGRAGRIGVATEVFEYLKRERAGILPYEKMQLARGIADFEPWEFFPLG